MVPVFCFAAFCYCLCYFFSWSALLQALLAFRASIEKLAVILMNFLLYVSCLFLLMFSIFFLCSTVYLVFLNNDILWGTSFLFLSIWCSFCFLYLYGYILFSLGKHSSIIFLKTWPTLLWWDYYFSSLDGNLFSCT